MRITGGAARGIPLTVPSRGEIRPATDGIREAVFSSLGDLPEGARVLDVFAGTGAYALEAISRGAKSALFVDKNPLAITAQKKNFAAVVKSLEARGLAVPKGEFLRADLLKPAPFPKPFPWVDLIFCDPPWDFWQDERFSKVVEMLTSFADEKTPWARIVLESPASFVPAIPTGWEVARQIAKKSNDQPSASILKRAE